MKDGYCEKGRRALLAAHHLVDSGDVEAVINRTYYAAFYMAMAALDTIRERPKTHAGTMNRFGFHFVRTGRLVESVADTYGAAFAARQSADYDTITVYDMASARDLLADVERFVAAVEMMLDPP